MTKQIETEPTQVVIFVEGDTDEVLFRALLIIRDASKAPELFEKSANVYVRMTEEDVYGKSAYIKAFRVEDLENFRAVEATTEA